MKSWCKGYVVDAGKVLEAHLDWLSHESGAKNRWRVAAEHGSAAALIAEIAGEVRARSLELRPMRSYRRRDDSSGKERLVTVESVKQQVCDYVVVRALQPMLDARLGFWQLGGRHVRDSLDLARAVRRWERGGGYWVHLDVRKCYQSIRTDLVRRLLAKYVRSPDVLYVVDRLLSMHGEGLALGSYLSLRLAQWVLSFGYHFVETLHKRRRGRSVALVTHQCWYMDDIWLFGRRKRDLQSAARQLERYLRDTFGLRLHPWQVCRVGEDEPVDVAGYVVRPGRVTLRAGTFLRADCDRRRFVRAPTTRHARSLASHKGQWTHTDSRLYRQRHDVDATVRRARHVISVAAREVAT